MHALLILQGMIINIEELILLRVSNTLHLHMVTILRNQRPEVAMDQAGSKGPPYKGRHLREITTTGNLKVLNMDRELLIPGAMDMDTVKDMVVPNKILMEGMGVLSKQAILPLGNIQVMVLVNSMVSHRHMECPHRLLRLMASLGLGKHHTRVVCHQLNHMALLWLPSSSHILTPRVCQCNNLIPHIMPLLLLMVTVNPSRQLHLALHTHSKLFHQLLAMHNPVGSSLLYMVKPELLVVIVLILHSKAMQNNLLLLIQVMDIKDREMPLMLLLTQVQQPMPHNLQCKLLMLLQLDMISLLQCQVVMEHLQLLLMGKLCRLRLVFHSMDRRMPHLAKIIWHEIEGGIG